MKRQVSGVIATADALRGASFLDGREPIGAPGGSLSFADLIGADGDAKGRAVPMIFHVSFCRSTLLSRLIDIPGATRALREPRVQIDQSDWLTALAVRGDDADFLPVLRAITRLLGRAGPADEAAFVKPTNWANVLLPSLLADPAAVSPVFVTMAPRAFLRAVFRGGRDRIAFTMRAAQHFAIARPDGARLLAAAISHSADPLDRAARLTCLALRFQLELFGQDPARCIDETEIGADPAAAAMRVAALLGLPLSHADIRDHAAAMLRHHAKAPESAFDPAGEGAADQVVEQHHGQRFSAALRWSESVR